MGLGVSLSFFSGCWILLWRPGGESPTAIYAAGRQHWDPTARTLSPALLHLPDGWWPSIMGGSSCAEPLHLVAMSGEPGFANILSRTHQSCYRISLADGRSARDGDVLEDIPPPPRVPSPGVTATSSVLSGCRTRRQWPFGLLFWSYLGVHLCGRSERRYVPGGLAWSLLMLACYLAAFGAPAARTPAQWDLDMTPVASLTARLHEYWWQHPLNPTLPLEVPRNLQVAWSAFPLWSGGVPSSLLLATDGSGSSQGSWAFAAWGFFKQRWYRIGWAGAPLSDTPWAPPSERYQAGRFASFYGELVALESAGLWLNAVLDLWYLHMRARPAEVTIAVDNAAALQIAAGHGKTTTATAKLARQAWQSVQARINTRFSHVHSHTGLVANSLADALAELAAQGHAQCRCQPSTLTISPDDFTRHFPRLWLLPSCTLRDGIPALPIPACAPPAAAPQQPQPPSTADTPNDRTVPIRLDLHILSANIQTIKDAPCNIFNPSGLAARRQYLYLQATQSAADIICIQEARSAAGRWKGGCALRHGSAG